MFGIGGFELFIILVFAFLIFGPEKLPEIGTMIGRAIAKFRDAQQEMSETLGDEKLFDPSNPDEPFKDPMEALDRMAQRQEERQKAKEKGAGASKSSETASTASTGPAKALDDAEASSQEVSEKPRQESFTERKARYERERAARKAAEAKAAAEGGDSPAGESSVTGSSDSKSEEDSPSEEAPKSADRQGDATVEGGGA